ncbi:AMP-binding protein [Streptomyces sp. NPDC006450]|uniref:class I adenylate-forming enzyme family protein n=1 Tax=Streptomyces sp. NPDC006450 TaxID=3155458 RepID=UPI0033B1CBD6
MWFQQILRDRLTRTPHALALRDTRRAVSWSRLDRDARALAHRIGRHTGPGDRVVVLCSNRVEVLEALFACALTRTVAVPLNPALADRELDGILARTTPVYALADPRGKTRLAVLRPALAVLDVDEVATLPGGPLAGGGGALTDPVMILHTSATSGFPKGVIADQEYFRHQALSWQDEVEPEPGTVYLHTSPLCHGSIVIAVSYLAARAPVAVLDQFTPAGFLTAAEAWKVQHTFLVPTMLTLLLESRQLPGSNLASLSLVMHGGAPCPPELAAQARKTLRAGLRTVFGITEGGGPVLGLGPNEGVPPAQRGLRRREGRQPVCRVRRQVR